MKSEAIVATHLVSPTRTRLRFVRPRRVTVGWPELYGAIVLAFVFVARFVPLARWIPTWGCKLRDFTGIPCLSCGMTRSFDWFAQGRFLDSLLINPLGFLLACSGVLLTLYFVAAPFRPPRPTLETTPHGAMVLRLCALGACVLNWVYLYVHGV
jgi:hypothetical protein